MKAVVFEGGDVRVEKRPDPAPAAGEALVRVYVAGVCSTDLQLARGYMGFAGIPGHEFVGRITAAPGAPDRVGQRVVGELNAVPDGCACEWCVAHPGDGRHCCRRTVLGILGRGGAFAEYLTLPLANLHAVPDSLPDDRAVFVEPVAAAFEIPEQLRVDGARTLVLGGGGRLGQLCARVLRLSGADVAVRGRRPEALADLLADGFDHADGDADRSYDVVVEATGSAEGLARACGWTRPRGTIVLKTTTADAPVVDLAPMVIDELTVVGSRCGPFAPAIEALAGARLTPETTIGARYPLERAADALVAAADPDPRRRKVLIDVGDRGGAA